jgi:hypothetical protein
MPLFFQMIKTEHDHFFEGHTAFFKNRTALMIQRAVMELNCVCKTLTAVTTGASLSHQAVAGLKCPCSRHRMRQGFSSPKQLFRG